MAENEVPAFASQEWMIVPFEVYPKLIFDQLIDVLFAVQHCLSVASELIKSLGNEAAALMKKLDKLIHDTMMQLHHWWFECIRISSSRSFGQERKSTLAENLESVPYDSKEAPMLPSINVQVAALSSLYDAANIIILRLLFLVSPLAASYDPRVRQHAQSIFAANNLINAVSGPARPAPDRGSIMMSLQLKVVNMWSPSSEQRATAAAMLQGGKFEGGGLSDMLTTAAPQEYYADVAAYILQQHPAD